MRKRSKVPAIAKIQDMAFKMAKFWSAEDGLRDRIGQEEFYYRMLVGAARKGREIGRKEERDTAWQVAPPAPMAKYVTKKART